MQVLRSPFRFAGQWALFPLLLGAAVTIGGALGLARGWAAAYHPAAEPWILALTRSPVLLIVATALIGMMTNSWSIATLTGGVTMMTAEVTESAARWHWLDTSATLSDVVTHLPLVVLAGGALALGGCIWLHEPGYPRPLGASLVGGALVWAAWQDLAPTDWPMNLEHLAGWIALVLAALLVIRCRGIGPFLVAATGVATVGSLVTLVGEGDAFELGSTLTAIRDRWDLLLDRLRSRI